jgi:hypothetical protein
MVLQLAGRDIKRPLGVAIFKREYVRCLQTYKKKLTALCGAGCCCCCFCCCCCCCSEPPRLLAVLPPPPPLPQVGVALKNIKRGVKLMEGPRGKWLGARPGYGPRLGRALLHLVGPRTVWLFIRGYLFCLESGIS